MGESNWRSVEVNIKRHDSGCWTWTVTPLACNVYHCVAEKVQDSSSCGAAAVSYARMPIGTALCKSRPPRHRGRFHVGADRTAVEDSGAAEDWHA